MADLVSAIAFRPQPPPHETFATMASREIQLSRLLMAYIGAGLFFMLLPGTFLGVWNLIAISRNRAAGSVSAAWIQAHGHAQIFGWIGTFILGIGYHSIPKLRRLKPFGLWAPWTTWALWISGVTLRWTCGVYEWHWRILMPLSAAFELAAFLIFIVAISGHRSEMNPVAKLDDWILVILCGCIGWAASLLINVIMAVVLAWRGESPVLPHTFDQRFLTLQTWGFLVPFIWGFSAKWLPIFLGLNSTRRQLLRWAVAVNAVGVLAALIGVMMAAATLLAIGVLVAVFALRLFDLTERPPKTGGVHMSFPFFVRVAYIWAGIAAALAIWASLNAIAPGLWGASRHALTVGFIAMMVFVIGQRILPAFSGMRLLFSTKLMFFALLTLTLGCALRVTAEILAYQNVASGAWAWLPVSAITEMTAVTLFGLNLLITLVKPRPAIPQ